MDSGVGSSSLPLVGRIVQSSGGPMWRIHYDGGRDGAPGSITVGEVMCQGYGSFDSGDIDSWDGFVGIYMRYLGRIRRKGCSSKRADQV